VHSNVVSTQTAHALYGGVVPELASREHQLHIVPVVDTALKEAGISKKELQAIAFTRGPGLLGSLIVGVTFAKSLALSLDIPLIDVHHMHAHVLAHFAKDPKPKFPFLCMTVSGGHTQIIKVNSALDMEVMGETLDDAAGEAFDKTGKMLGLPYPAGPLIDQYAQKGKTKYKFPKSQVKGLDFSFSGLKTAVMYFLKRETNANPQFIQEEMPHICASIQSTIVETLLEKLSMAVESTGIKQIAIAGGVAANSGLRDGLFEMATEQKLEAFIPEFEYCRDNAAMIGITAHFKYLENKFCGQDVSAEARMPF
ncbi:MAG: tRNA (adenosine(37)-N6)-threonylcarbamoyltransferase complex transferase subunit TsaD, partial [Saprospiraceae bacterium]|nr:tRNA (adenosine(37)-N6)-threonylcarbamoyltransferase complex transferase subunit TsaD [Saprospiraceae bacterium]